MSNLFARAEASFIGTITGPGTSEELEGETTSDNLAIRYEVERYLSGELTRPTLVVAVGDDSCGYAIDPGRRQAVFVSGISDGVPNASQCTIADPERTLRTLAQMGVDPDAGDASLLLVTTGGDPHLWLLDDRGRRAGYATRPQDGLNLMHASLCPGGTRVAETWLGTAEVVVRDLTTLQETSRTIRPRGPSVAVCLDRAGSELAYFFGAVNDSRLWLPGVDEAIMVQHGLEVLPGRPQLVSYGINGVQLIAFDGTVTDLWGPKQGEEFDYLEGMDGVSVSPDGQRLAFAIWNRGGLSRVATAVIIDLDTRSVIEAEFAPLTANRMRWLSDDLLWLGHRSVNRQQLLDRELSVVPNLGENRLDAKPWNAWAAGQGRVWYLQDSVVARRSIGVDPASADSVGVEEKLAEFETIVAGEEELHLLPSPIQVSADLPLRRPVEELGVLPVATAPGADSSDGAKSSDREIADPEGVRRGSDNAVPAGMWLLGGAAFLALSLVVVAVAGRVASRR